MNPYSFNVWVQYEPNIYETQDTFTAAPLEVQPFTLRVQMLRSKLSWRRQQMFKSEVLSKMWAQRRE
jgi:hypothetical protein